MYGMGSMYGMGGMGGGMYGMGGMGSGMYGMGGLGGGMYGGGYGGGLGGGYGSSGLYGSNTYGGSTFGNNNNYSQLGAFGNNNNNGGLLNDPNSHMTTNGASAVNNQSSSLLPAPPDQPGSPINQTEAPPPLNETAEERARRIRSEQRKQRQLIKQQRDQLRQVRMKAKLEIAGHLTNVFVQTLRSTMELFAVCFGTYYSMKAVRAFSASQEMMSGYQRGPNGQLIPRPGGAAAATASQGGAVSKVAAATQDRVGSRWRSYVLFVALFLLGETLYAVVARQRERARRKQQRQQRATEDEFGNVLTPQRVESLSGFDSEESQLSAEEDDLERAFQSATSAHLDRVHHPRGRGDGRRVYVALYDYDPPREAGEGDNASVPFARFKAGDEFVVDDYVSNGWCEAVAMDGTTHTTSTQRMLVPGNFLRLLETATKL